MTLRSFARRALGGAVIAAAITCLTASAHRAALAAPGTLPMAVRPMQQATPGGDPDQVYYYLGGYAPCNLKGHHSITPQTVEEGKNITVKVDYEFNCGSQAIKQVDMVFMIENTGMLKQKGVNGQQEPLHNLKLALGNLARRIDPTNGSRVGMVKYGCDNHTDPPIGRGIDHFERWRTSIQTMNGNLAGGSNPSTALREASGQIAALAKPDPTDPPSFIIIIDAGGIPCNGAPAPQVSSLGPACNAAKSNQATVVLVALQTSGGRLRGCNTPGWYFRSSSETGADLDGIFEQIQERIFTGTRPYRTAYTVYPNTYLWDYQFGSGRPTEPNVIFPDLAWEEDLGNRKSASFNYEYQMTAKEASGPAAWASIAIKDAGIPSPQIQFLYNDGTSDQIVVPDTPLCIFRPGKEAVDCGLFLNQVAATAVAATATTIAFQSATVPPTVATPDPDATDVPTVEVPTTEVPTATPMDTPTTVGPVPTVSSVPPPTDTDVPPDTATPEPRTGTLYLPWSARSFGF